MSYIDELYNKLKQRNYEIEPHKEVITWYTRLVEENNILKEQLHKNNQFIKNNMYELHNSPDVGDIIQQNQNLITYKFYKNVKTTSIDLKQFEETYF